MATKTIRISKVIDIVNFRLAESTCNADVRQGMCVVIEAILFDTGNYKGYSYLNTAKHPGYNKPGHDETRRKYCWKK